MNHILTDRISDILFCPTQTAIANLKNEGYDTIDIKQVQYGDVMYDAALFYTDRSSKPDAVVENDNFVLSTIHRQENTDDKEKLTAIFEALKEIAQYEKVILPLHPRTIKNWRDLILHQIVIFKF